MMFETDPTLAFLERLNDESKWVIRRNIPIFEPHTRMGTGPDGKPRKVTVTADDLSEIARNSQRLFDVKGVPGRLTDRHTIRQRSDGAGMEPVPNVVLFGFEKNYRTGTYGPSGTPCVLCDWYLFPEHAAEASRRPHRSVEYQHESRLIRGTAVMNNDPFLDMGVVSYEGSASPHWSGMAARPLRELQMMTMYEKPANHDEGVSWMLAHPGMTYEKALNDVSPETLRDAEALQYAEQHGTSLELARILVNQREKPKSSNVFEQVGERPGLHELAYEHMFANPGMTYEAACKWVLTRRNISV